MIFQNTFARIFFLVTMAQRDSNFTFIRPPLSCFRARMRPRQYANGCVQQVTGNFKCTRRRNVHRLLSTFAWPVVNVAVYLPWRQPRQKSFPLLCESKCRRIRNAGRAIRDLAKRRERNSMPAASA